MTPTAAELLAALLADLPGDLIKWTVTLSLLGRVAALIAAHLARGRHWIWHAVLGLLVVGILAVPSLAMIDEANNYECEECTCPTGPCGVPAALDSQPGWVEVG